MLHGLVQLERALQLSADMQKRSVPRNVHTHSALMNVCIKCGQLRLALECWENMQRDAIEPNVVRPLSPRRICTAYRVVETLYYCI